MPELQHATAVGVFANQNQAQQAIAALEAAGFNHDQIGYVTRGGEAAAVPGADLPGGDKPEGSTGETGTGADTRETAVKGAVVGGVLGAAVALVGASILLPGVGTVLAGGLLASALGGAAVGAAGGGLLGALTSMGVPPEEIRTYERDFNAGHTIVAIRAANRYLEALDILRRNGAQAAPAGSGAPA